MEAIFVSVLQLPLLSLYIEIIFFKFMCLNRKSIKPCVIIFKRLAFQFLLYTTGILKIIDYV